MVTFRQIEAFKATMDNGTVNKAAEAMGLSQPAVSRLLSDFEANVGFPLFERRKGRLSARREARELYAEVERSFIGLERIVETASRIGQARNTRLRLAVLPAFSMGGLPGAVARLLNDHPNLFVSIENLTRHQILEGIAAGNYDLGFASVPIQTPDVGFAPLLKTDIVCLVPAQHPLSKHDVITPAELDGVTAITGVERTPLRLKLDQVLHDAGVRWQRRIEVNTLQMACALISQGLGISFFARWFLTDSLPRGVCAIPFRPEILLDFAVLYPIGQPPDGIAAAFVQKCREAA